MTLVEDRPYDEFVSLDEIEQQLLALGPMPRQGEGSWDSMQWAQYHSLVRNLVVELNWVASPWEASVPSA